MVDGCHSFGTLLMEDADPLFSTLIVCGYWLGREESGAIAKKGFVGGHP